MSRVGKAPVAIPKGATVQLRNGVVALKGPKGEMTIPMPPDITVAQESDRLVLKRANDLDATRAKHGLAQRLLRNAVLGVTQGFTRELEIVGVGFRAAKSADKLVLSVGYTRPVDVRIPKGVDVAVESNTKIVLKGADKHVLGQLAADIRAVRPPSVYSDNKGIRYSGERVRKKAGKTAGAGATGAAGGAK
ncbi:MAG: 50S ribosomal protein L6 [Candidatus Lindowbacteria bacterium RIFCSPLOWO2_12_FULL_62_27]|nr:ribosomal protein L6 [uncultured bacterium]OGH59722.1 MAG: 50S ribosomal protein L6 [Candidatus Lindowbacteria bacterium RIFCSPLOWO2_12_FULL_62_27]